MESIPDDLTVRLFTYLDFKSQYNLLLINKDHEKALKRVNSHNLIWYIMKRLGVSHSDLYDNFFSNFVKDESIIALKEIISILEPKSFNYKPKNNYGFSLRYYLIRNKTINQCKYYIKNYNNEKKISLFNLSRKNRIFSTTSFNDSLYRNSRNVFCILI